MSSNNWRNELYTFADEEGQIYTVTNVPPIISVIPSEDSELLTNITLGSLLRPRLNVRSFPELPFVLQRDPVGDPLLSRLCLDPATLVPVQFEGGWALDDDLRNAWIRLEKGLLYVSDLLMTSTERSACGTSARYAIRHQAHWPPPEDYGYRQLHQSARAAETSIRRAHLAFRLLIARCSLAISLWIFPGPEEGGTIPQVRTNRYDDETNTFVPRWVSFLEDEGVPSSWIDAIRDSIITDFSINLRVGTVIDPTNCEWLPMLPVLRAANVPVFVMWRNPSEVVQSGASLPFMKLFTPSKYEVHLALQHLPTGKPRIVTICRGDLTRPLPNHSEFDDSTPPFGPYQRPGESRLEFFKRREHYRGDQARQESHLQVEWRRERMAHADAGLPPFRRSRVYLWVHAQYLYPDLLPRWLGYEYRHPIPPSAYRSFWMVHPPNCRQYNPFFDEWDLWFPPGWGDWCNDSTELRLVQVSPGKVSSTKVSAKVASQEMVATTVNDEQELLIQSPEDRQIRGLDFLLNSYLHSWYGLWVADTQLYSDVDYDKYERHLVSIFAEMKDKFPTDVAIRKCISGWTWAILERKFGSSALTHTWDLDERHPRYLFREGATDPRNLISMDHHQAAQGQRDRDDVKRWVRVTFQKDPATQNWSLFTSPMGALLLVRHIDEAQTSSVALPILIAAGIPVRTGISLEDLPLPISSLPARPLRLPFRKRGERPGPKDYDAYYQRVLELSRRPYARAAWLKGGIVWRIMMEVTGRYPGEDRVMTFRDELGQGPSGLVDHYQLVTMELEGSAYYDDDLSAADLDVISGVVRVFTGIGAQTEDASWWPKHTTWVKGAGYSGIWTAADEHWFNTRLQKIYDNEAQPMNAGEWRDALRKHKTTGRVVASIVDEQAWIFTSNHFGCVPSPV